jgi:hypothetical protein
MCFYTQICISNITFLIYKISIFLVKIFAINYFTLDPQNVFHELEILFLSYFVTEDGNLSSSAIWRFEK